ncbi:MlaD family protein [Nocardia flavorosea]|uniref:MCE family protein n=1 Tax=Nocardia flavorosea TaxID=53429 RepID=A0A846YUA5_9NOCA|nr:MlaD family protein [Nocardia flavorosea]NKY61034.1 MCE family protein [Nocardia flavorosea]
MARIVLKLVLFGVVIAVLLAGIVTAIERPIQEDTHEYDAVFSDASGLKPGDDVRMYGVAVGKVRSVRLDRNLARVRFAAIAGRPVFDNSTLAIRYQNLTGQRYLDVQQPESPGTPIEAGATVGLAHTVPSFDVTVLFNGLRPVLEEYSPESLNQLTQNMIAVIEGDGTGIGPALDSIATLSRYTADRQAVISVLIRNLSQISEQLGGKSPQSVVLLTQLANLFDELQRKVEGVVDFAMTAPAVMEPLDSLLATIGLTRNSNPDLEALMRRSFPDVRTAIDVLDRLPGVLQSLQSQLPANASEVALRCSRGEADLPSPIGVLVAGQRVVVCR